MGEPGGILGEIVARKRQDVAARLAGVSLSDLRAQAQPTDRSLAAAIALPGTRFIMEVKRASPSQGLLRPEADPAALARAYRGVADAVSVLIDTPYFGGSYADLAQVRAAFFGPVLAKDFVVDARQVAEARLHGADAILVMLSVLDDQAAREVMAQAALLGMDALVEVHDAHEVARAIALDARLIGINNRDLRTLEVDLATTERLAPLIPGDRLVVAESGIGDRLDLARLACHADAFLVGSSLMRAANPGQAARALAFGRVKVCGLTSVPDVRSASKAGASHCGFILVPGTPRAVTIAKARPLAEAARSCGARTVGVFRNERVDQVVQAARALRLDVVQLHGQEDRAYIEAARNMLGQDVEIWGASGVTEAVQERPGADRLLFDAVRGGQSGGTGALFDWDKVAGRRDMSNSLLAGGLSAQNARAAAALGAYALDVGSGVEASPGSKDPERLRAFFDALRLPGRGDDACG